MQIQFSSANYLRLLDHVLAGSPESRALEKIKVITSGPDGSTWCVIDCDLDVAEALLVIARKHGPSAVEKLEAAIAESISRAKKG